MTSRNSFKSQASLTVGADQYTIYRLDALNAVPGNTVATLPFS